jgi:dihydropyrimidine dehydrogenase (NAD+) subunit PreA
MQHTCDLAVTFCGLPCPNPFLLSSSPVSNSAEMCLRALDAGWGGVVYKTLNRDDRFRVIMPSPRLHPFHCDEARLVGLQNAEQISDRPLKDNLADLALIKKRFPDRLLVSSIMGYEDEDWAVLARASEDAGADLLELNFSCPQMARKDAGHRVGQDFDAVTRYTEATKTATRLPVMAKMTPNITDMVPVALAAKRGGADAIAAINTVRVISDVDLATFTPCPTIGGRSGITGFSGPAVKPIAMRFVAELANAPELGLPISAIGGIETWVDALHFLLLGGTTLQVTTGVMKYGYRIVEDLKEGLSDFLVDRGFASLEPLIGAAARKLVDPSDFDHRHQVVSVVDEARCIGCGRCHISCADGANQAMAFDPQRRKAQVDEARCVGCLLCRHVCPVDGCIGVKEVDTAVTPHAAVPPV